MMMTLDRGDVVTYASGQEKTEGVVARVWRSERSSMWAEVAWEDGIVWEYPVSDLVSTGTKASRIPEATYPHN